MSSSAGLARPAGGRALVSLGSEHLALRPVPTPQHAAPGGNRTTVGDGVNEAPSEPKARMHPGTHPGQGRSLRGRRLLLPTQGRGEGSLDEHAEETASQAFS